MRNVDAQWRKAIVNAKQHQGGMPVPTSQQDRAEEEVTVRATAGANVNG